jgi:5-methylcytosine-specific restriction endonuclease McrA
MGKTRAFSKHIKWVESEIQVVTDYYPSASYESLLVMLPGRTLSQIQNKANGLGMTRIKPLKMTPEQVREAKRKHMAKRRLENPEASRAYHAQRHYKNHEKNKEAMRAYASKRFFWVKAMKLRGADRATTKQIASVWKKQKGLCALTGLKLDRSAQLDHKLPKCRGGADNVNNLQWLSMNANLAKRHMTDDEFISLCANVMRWLGERIQMVEDMQKENDMRLVA